MTVAVPVPETHAALRHRAITAGEFRRMAEVGILAPHERVELIEGKLCEMTPIGPRHAFLVGRLAKALIRAIEEPLAVEPQGALEISTKSQVQPDLMILRREPASLDDPLPTPADVLLAIEVADTSLAYDRDVKLPLYAGHGIPEVWIVDAAAKVIGVFSEPREGTYRDSRRCGAGERLAPGCAPKAEIDLAKIFA